jgi:hypothetical protein
MAIMLSFVRSSSVALLSPTSTSSAIDGIGGGGIGRSGLPGKDSKEVVRAMLMRVRSMSDMDILGWGFLMGEGVAAPMEFMI